jgi:prolyl-tRNA synthetase
MAMPVITGAKTDAEKFAGAVRTYAIEALMQDNRALQAGTSHNLGQNFAKAFEVRYQTTTGDWEYVWSTSWGVSTRLIGGLVMTHSDDKGLICPPRLAPLQVIVVPIWKSDSDQQGVLEAAQQARQSLVAAGVSAQVDDRDAVKPGAKYYHWEARGVPVRLEIGPRDVAQGQVVLARRTGGKASVPLAGLADAVRRAMDEIQAGLLEAARQRREANSVRNVKDREALKDLMNGAGGFAYAGYCGEAACETAVKEATKATIRVLPDGEFRSSPAPATCVWCGGPAVTEAVWAKAY